MGKTGGSDNLIYGLHAIEGILKRDPGAVHELWLDKGRKDRRIQELERRAEKSQITITRATRQELEKLAGNERHQGVVAEVRGSSVRNETFLEQLLVELDVPPFLLVLDGVQDPHNLGACLRSADAAGVHAIIAPRDRACGLTPTVRKVASGAAETVPFIQVTNLARTLKQLQQTGIWVVGTALEEAATPIHQQSLSGSLALVMGAEGQGMRRLTRETCDQLVYIPMQGSVQSLNVSVATGICLFEALRQREITD